MKNKILKFAFSTMLAVLLATMTAAAQDVFDKVLFMFLDENGATKYAEATELKTAADFGESPELGESGQTTWYIVKGSISLNKTMDIYGDVHLILEDGAELSVNGGNSYGCYIFGSLTLYSQSYGDDMGKLTVKGDDGFLINNALTINGGFVTAQGANDGRIDIYGDFTFNGGKLVANTGYYQNGNATIGYNSPDDYVQIKEVPNGSVTIKPGRFFIVEGGDVAKGTISADDFNSKFGGKKLTPYGYKVTINNTYVVYVLPNGTIDASPIGYTLSNVKDEDNNDFDLNTPVTKDLNLTATLTPIEYTITYVLGDNATNGVGNLAKYTVETETFTLNDPSRDNCEFSGWIYEGQFEPTKDVTIKKGSIGNKSFFAKWKVNVPFTYLDANGNTQEATATELTSVWDFGRYTELGESGQTTWYIVKGSISLNKTLYFNGDVHLILADNAELSVNVSEGYGCYIRGSLTLYSQSYGDDMGKMTVEGEDGFYTNNALTINGGFITAKGADDSRLAIYGNFTFNGGKLVANTGNYQNGNATIGYNSPDNYVQIKKLYNSSVTIKDGQHFTAADFNSKFGGKKLMPRSHKVTIKISGEDYIVDVPHGKTLTPPTKAGYDFVNCKDANGADFDIATAITEDLELTAEWKPLPATAPTITADLADLSLEYGYEDGNVLTVDAEAATGHTLSYQWYSNTSSSNEGGVAIDGETSASYTILTGKNAGVTEYYYCVVTATRDDNNATATTASACAMVTVKDKIEEHGALTITENQDGKVAVFDGSYRGSEPFKIDEKITGLDHVEFKRTFSSVGEYSTIMLPLALENPGQYGTFARFEDVHQEDDKWIVDMVTLETVEAFTPYLFLPNSTEPQFKWNVTELEKTASTSTEYSVTQGDWTFTGVTEVKRWNSDDNSDYGFAGQTSTSTGTYSIGEFIKVGSGAKLSIFRCFLTKKRSSISKAAVELPASLEVRIINAVTEPEIEPIDLNDDGDIKTPVSEINPAKSDVKVWSYDKTIIIESAPNTAYRIIDAAGRVLKNDITNSTRDEIRLGNTSGIVIVIINGKTFKIKY